MNMEKIPLPKKIFYPKVGGKGKESCCAMQLTLLEKLNEIVGWINEHRGLAEMLPEEIEKIGKYIQELDKMEWTRSRGA